LGFSWLVYTTLPAKDATNLGDALKAAVQKVVDARPALAKKGGWGDISVEEVVPSSDDVLELSEAYERPVSDEVLSRLDRCVTALSVERYGASDLDALQVSMLRYVLGRTGPALIDWGDIQVVLSEDVLAEIDQYDSVGDLGV
jgi:hypothetical protein